jgi:aerobic-type carbon monoxide dehydrogenase small subunit (CoxS/CutS family)
MIHLKVNERAQTFDGDPEMPLLWYVRDVLGLMGTKFGCGMALCGACTVLQNGKAVRSCSKQMSTVEGPRDHNDRHLRARPVCVWKPGPR